MDEDGWSDWSESVLDTVAEGERRAKPLNRDGTITVEEPVASMIVPTQHQFRDWESHNAVVQQEFMYNNLVEETIAPMKVPSQDQY